MCHMTKDMELSCFNQKGNWRTNSTLPDRSTGDISGIQEAKSFLQRMLRYSRLTTVSTQHAGRPMIVCSSNVPSTQQDSIMGMPLRTYKKYRTHHSSSTVKFRSASSTAVPNLRCMVSEVKIHTCSSTIDKGSVCHSSIG